MSSTNPTSIRLYLAASPSSGEDSSDRRSIISELTDTPTRRFALVGTPSFEKISETL